MSEHRKFTEDILVVTLTNMLTSLKGVILLPLLAKYIGALGYGIWAQFNITLALLVPFSTLGLAFALTRFIAGENDKSRIPECFYSILSIVLVSSLFVSLLLKQFEDIFLIYVFRNANLSVVVNIIAITIPLSAINILFLNFFRALRENKIYSICILSQNLIEIALVVILITSGYGVDGAIVPTFISKFLADIVIYIAILRLIGFKYPTFSNVTEYLTIGIPIMPTDVFTWIVYQSDRYLLAFFMGMESVGIYSAAYNIGNIISVFANPITNVLSPAASKLYDENNMHEVKIYLSYSLKYFLLMGIPSVFGLSILSNTILDILSNKTFAVAGSAIVMFVTLSSLFFGVFRIFSLNLILSKKTIPIGLIWGIVGVIDLSLNFILIPTNGLIGAAISSSIAFFTAMIIIKYLAFREVTFPIDYMSIIKSIIASVLMSIVIINIIGGGIMNFVSVIVIGALIYIILILIMGVFSLNELKFFRNMLRTRN